MIYRIESVEQYLDAIKKYDPQKDEIHIIAGTGYEIGGNAQVGYVSDNAQVGYVSGNAQVRSVFDNAQVRLFSANSKILKARDNGIIVCVDCKPKILSRSKNVSVLYESGKNISDITAEGWVDRMGADTEKGKIILYKRVSSDLKTQEGTENETEWKIGAVNEIKAWTPKENECGHGKYHGCAHVIDTNLFRNEKADDKYIKLLVDKKDCYAWPRNPQYPMKIGFKKGLVMCEVDKDGKPTPAQGK